MVALLQDARLPSTLGWEDFEVKRIAFEADEDLVERINTCLPWGMKAAVLRVVLELVVEAVEKEGAVFLGAVLSNEVRLTGRPRADE